MKKKRRRRQQPMANLWLNDDDDDQQVVVDQDAATKEAIKIEPEADSHESCVVLPIDSPMLLPSVAARVEAELHAYAAERRAAERASASSTQMDPTALVFLDDPIARRLAVAWQRCGGNDETWFETAGFARHAIDATRIAKALKINGICRAGGITDPLALTYVQAIIAKPLAAAARTKRGKE